MKKNHTIRNLILAILIFGILGGGLYYYFFVKEGNVVEDIIPGIVNKKSYDVKNGIYVYKNKLDKTLQVFSGCIVGSIDDYIVVINDKYKMYHGSCMVMKYLKEGNTSELDFSKEKEKDYSIKYNNKEYKKDNGNISLVPANNVNSLLTQTKYSTLKFIINNTEVEGEYYSLSAKLMDNFVGYVYSLRYTAGNNFVLDISKDTSIYTKTFSNIKDLPRLYFGNNTLYLIERLFGNNKYNGNLLIYRENANIYNFDNYLPLKINNEVLDRNYNILHRYDSVNNVFYVVFSKDNNFCDKNSKYRFYEFKITYDGKNAKYKVPDLYKKGKNDNDCNYIKKYYLEG